MYPIDRRKIANHIYSLLHSLRKTSKLLQVSHSTIYRWLKNPERKKYSMRKAVVYKSETIIEIIRLAIQNDPFISIYKLKILIKDSLNIIVSKELIRIAIYKCGYSKKKARFYGKPKNIENITLEFINQRNKYIKENRRFLSIDETSFGRNGIETKGYSQIGKPLYIQKQKQTIITTSSVCCSFSNGCFTRKETIGSFNTNKFLDFLKFIDIRHNDVVLLDNVRFHHSRVVLDYLTKQKADVLFVPPYSPWFNPIELCFSIVKRTYYKNRNIDEAYKSLFPHHVLAFFTKSLNTIGPF
jgi:transposase